MTESSKLNAVVIALIPIVLTVLGTAYGVVKGYSVLDYKVEELMHHMNNKTEHVERDDVQQLRADIKRLEDKIDRLEERTARMEGRQRRYLDRVPNGN